MIFFLLILKTDIGLTLFVGTTQVVIIFAKIFHRKVYFLLYFGKFVNAKIVRLNAIKKHTHINTLFSCTKQYLLFEVFTETD